MIHRIESIYLRTQDSLSKRDRGKGSKRPVPRERESEPTIDAMNGPHQLQEEHVSVTLDLVA
jgi:hypothetical protein